tara:strand:+ start:5842 stop:6402 length:561 start_codon:yes stop_codon:yes gene_type:complete
MYTQANNDSAKYERCSTPHFSNVYQNTQPKYNNKVTTIFVDSRDKDPSMNDFSYSIYFEHDSYKSISISSIKKVSEITIKNVCFPKVMNEDYVILDISELQDNIISTDNSGSHRSTAITYFDSSTLAPGERKPCYVCCNSSAKLNPEIDLSKLTVKFMKHGGDLVQLTDTNNVSQHSFTLEIVHSE